ncbi:PKD domain-containing protein [uncultured Methanospirillum sp.]|uniref:PKD domain-containing protein n=1 Tax=uncultured Methanospirillum sp. TaxID=262503 RepID=UPI0029C816F7|nr:PKD domain-containing protein [uncultured Methanospirillum sp.]
MKNIAVSDIIAVVLLISVVTVAMGIVGVMVTRDIVPTEIPHMNFEACINGTDIFLYHNGGDSLLETQNNTKFYAKFLDSNKNPISITQFNPVIEKQWSIGTIKTISTGLQPTLSSSIKYVQIITRSSGGIENLIGWAQVRSCTGDNNNPDSSCLARPYAAFIGSPQSGDPPLSVSFIDQSKSDTTYPITSRIWDFGDGNTSTEQNPTHVFTNSGISYTVKLRVHNLCGTDEVTHTITTGSTPCSSSVTASIKTDKPTTGSPPSLTISFTDNSTTTGGSSIVSRLWKFGDGNTSTEQNPTHTFYYGIYYTSLTVTDSCGNENTVETQISVINDDDCVATASFEPNTTYGKPPLTILFTDKSSTNHGQITSWNWDFGDGNTSTEENPTHTFYDEKTYVVNLSITNSCERLSFTSENITASSCENQITVIQSNNGVISPAGPVNVSCSGSSSFTITTDICYQINDVIINQNQHLGTQTSPYIYTFTNVQSDQNITANFIVHPNFVFTTQNTGGIISPNGPISVSCMGDSQPLTVLANSCFNISDIIINGSYHLGSQSSPFYYTFKNVTTNQSIEASFAQRTYNISSLAGSGGTISPSGNTTVSCGQDQTYLVNANTCYNISDIIINGTSFGSKPSPYIYSFTNVTDNQTIQALFTQRNYNITASAGSGGTISPSGNTTVTCGQNQDYVITAGSCFNISDIVINGVSSPGSRNSPYTYSFTNVTNNQTIQALFTLKNYNITASAGSGGTISPNGNTTVKCGQDQDYVITAGSCYNISDIIINGTSFGANTSPYTYSFTSVTDNQTIQAVFTKLYYTITASVTGTGGTISPGGAVSVECNNSQTFTFTPSSGYRVNRVWVDGVRVYPSGNSYTINNVTANHTIMVSFRRG